jgi:hypothetical protein
LWTRQWQQIYCCPKNFPSYLLPPSYPPTYLPHVILRSLHCQSLRELEMGGQN